MQRLERLRVEHVCGAGATAASGVHCERHVVEPGDGMSIGRADDRDAGLDRRANVLAA
jgi:hypothetical protein